MIISVELNLSGINSIYFNYKIILPVTGALIQEGLMLFFVEVIGLKGQFSLGKNDI